MSKNTPKNTDSEEKDPNVITAPTLGDDNTKEGEAPKDPLAEAIENETTPDATQDTKTPEVEKDKAPEDKKSDDKEPKKDDKKKSNEKPVNTKSQEPPKADKSKPTEQPAPKKEKPEPVFNENGEKKLTPEEVLAQLSLYDDFTIMRGWEVTKFKFEFEKLLKTDRILNVKETREFLKARGHKV